MPFKSNRGLMIVSKPGNSISLAGCGFAGEAAGFFLFPDMLSYGYDEDWPPEE
jgi:hypothetical protein